MHGVRRVLTGALLVGVMTLPGLGPLASAAVAKGDDQGAGAGGANGGVTICAGPGDCLTLTPLSSDENCMSLVEEVDVELCSAPKGLMTVGPLPGKVDDVTVSVAAGPAIFAVVEAAGAGASPCCSTPEQPTCPPDCLLTGTSYEADVVGIAGAEVAVEHSEVVIRHIGEARAHASSIEVGIGQASVERFDASIQEDGGIRTRASSISVDNGAVSIERASVAVDPDGRDRVHASSIDVSGDSVTIRRGSTVVESGGEVATRSSAVLVAHHEATVERGD